MTQWEGESKQELEHIWTAGYQLAGAVTALDVLRVAQGRDAHGALSSRSLAQQHEEVSEESGLTLYTPIRDSFGVVH